MGFSGLADFIHDLEKRGELQRIKIFTDPVLEIAEVTDRVTKSNGKALLFENTGTQFPVLINAFGSDIRMAAALGGHNPETVSSEIEKLFGLVTEAKNSLREKLSSLPGLLEISGFMPSMTGKRGKCQKNIVRSPDLDMLPVLKCWPHDAGRFITLPMVHTIHPETGKTNVGMYRMQVLGKQTTAMHWQRHKTGSVHFAEWGKRGKRMPVTVTLGGDPVYTYCATAPLPENISEYILAGFLRKKKVRLVKCLTNDLYIPEDADIVIEGYVDPSEDFVKEGPFGDHTGFYSLSDNYPVFHVTCITHSDNAVYPATIVGIPPHEDAWLTKATEKIFLAPLKLAIQPEIIDFHMPEAGVAHNMVIVKIRKSYPGQGMKVLNSLFGAGQMMFTKYLLVVDGDTDIRDYRSLIGHVIRNTCIDSDIMFIRGPMDVLDHSSDNFSFGGKAGIDATVKLDEERGKREKDSIVGEDKAFAFRTLSDVPFIKELNSRLIDEGIGVLIISTDRQEDPASIEKIAGLLQESGIFMAVRLVVVVDNAVDTNDYFMVAWQVLGNSDPVRDHYILSGNALMIDGTIKLFSGNKFPRRWPNVVCSDEDTIRKIDEKWMSLGFNEFIPSPSLRYGKLSRPGTDEVVTDQ